jgi:hypothetical protein
MARDRLEQYEAEVAMRDLKVIASDSARVDVQAQLEISQRNSGGVEMQLRTQTDTLAATQRELANVTQHAAAELSESRRLTSLKDAELEEMRVCMRLLESKLAYALGTENELTSRKVEIVDLNAQLARTRSEMQEHIRLTGSQIAITPESLIRMTAEVEKTQSSLRDFIRQQQADKTQIADLASQLIVEKQGADRLREQISTALSNSARWVPNSSPLQLSNLKRKTIPSSP